MARAGHPKSPQETGLEFARRLSTGKPELNATAWAITEKYYYYASAREHY